MFSCLHYFAVPYCMAKTAMVCAMWPTTLHTPSHAVSSSHCPSSADWGSGGISAAVAPSFFRMFRTGRASSAEHTCLVRHCPAVLQGVRVS